MEITEGVFGDHVVAVDVHTADGFGDPGGVAAEQLVVFRGPGELHQTQLHDEVVDEFLRLLFGEDAPIQIPLDIDVQEGGGAAQAHGGAVLFLDGGQVAEVQPLHRFLGVLSRLRNIKAVDLAQFFQIVEGVDLVGELFPQADVFAGHPHQGGVFLVLLVGNQPVHAVQGHPAVVADDPAPAVGVGQAGDDGALPSQAHFRSVDIEHALVVGFAVFGEDFHHFRIHVIAVGFAGVHGHADAAEGLQGTLEGLVRLEPHNLFQILVQITRAMAGDGGDDLGVHIQHTAGFPFLFGQLHDLIPQSFGSFGGRGEEGLIPVIGGDIFQDEVPDINGVIPFAGYEPFPLGAELVLHWHSLL